MSKETVLYFIIYFVLYSFAGWVLESVSKSIMQRKLVNSGFLIGPICPIYGLGAIIMILCLNPLKEMPVLLFISAFFILSVWEYVVGVILEKLFKTKYWDYSHLKFNIQGRVCLKNSIYWGVLGLVFICFINPFVESYVVNVPINILMCIDIAVIIVLIIDIFVSINDTVNFETAINKINELGDLIKDKLEEINIKSKKNAEEKTKIEIAIRNLKRKQTKLKIKLYRQAIRLKKAFPSMKSEIMNKFLNQKIDLRKLKDSMKNKE